MTEVYQQRHFSTSIFVTSDCCRNVGVAKPQSGQLSEHHRHAQVQLGHATAAFTLPNNRWLRRSSLKRSHIMKVHWT